MEKKKSSLFQVIRSHAEAAKTIREVSIGFLSLAGLQGLIGAFLMPGLIIDAIMIAALAGLLWWLRSRIVAVLLLLLSLGMLCTTALTLLGIAQLGGRNLWLAVIVFWCAIKGVEATFKINGRYKTPEPAPPPIPHPQRVRNPVRRDVR